MKRSKINAVITEAIKYFIDLGFRLPPFAFWTVKDWDKMGHEANEIRDNALGWDITDYGFSNYDGCGLLLFTLRNGNHIYSQEYPKTYAEKIMMIKEKQFEPFHFHWKKREDIINRGGGDILLQLYQSTPSQQLSDEPFTISIDGIKKNCAPGEKIVLEPGSSICIEPLIFHSMLGLDSKGDIIVGEVSDVNDDVNDNFFLDPVSRYPSIEEDEEPLYLLCHEYPSP